MPSVPEREVLLRRRSSIEPTYDRRETGDRFTVESRLHGRRISLTPIADPFVCQRVVIGWRDLLRGLFRRRLEVETLVSGDREIVEDVMELNADYLGLPQSTRRREWNAGLERALGDFAARAGEHDVS